MDQTNRGSKWDLVVTPEPWGELSPNLDPVDPTTAGDSDPGDVIGDAGPGLLDARAGDLMENEDPTRARIFRRRGGGGLLGRLAARLWETRPGRPLSDEEKSARAEMARRRSLEKTLRADAENAIDLITAALTRRGLCYVPPKGDRMAAIRTVKYSDCVLQPEAIWLKVDTKRLPWGVSIPALYQEELLTDLSLACGRRVTVEFGPEKGLWYIVERAAGVRGIPAHVQLSDMLTGFKASHGGLTIPFGMGINSKKVYIDLARMHHMLVGGTTGAGKSNFLNVVITTLIRRNSPSRLKLLMVDLKGGLEFGYYRGIPHLLSIPIAEDGIIEKRTEVVDLLRWVLGEVERRIGVLREAGYKDIARYNARNRKHALPHLMLVCDEWADVKLERKTGREAEDLLINIASRSRAVGIHVIICTQVPKKEVIETRLKGVMPIRVAFSCPTNQASMAILDNGHAARLAPEGRCIIQYYDEIMVQSPFITDRFITETVEGAIRGEFTELQTTHDVTLLEILEWALEHDTGYLSRDKLFDHFRDRGITVAEISTWLKETEEEGEIVIGSGLYRVEPAAGSRPRRLVAVMDEPNDPEPPQVGP